VLILAFIVLFHETGHYLAGRALGLQADEFSIGLGPKIWGFQAFGDTFSLRALPFGGYVSFPASQVQAMPPVDRLVVLTAGVAFNQLLAFLVFLHQILFGDGLSKPKIERGILVTGVMEEGAAKGKLQLGDVILAIDGKPVKMPPSPSAPRAHRAITQAIQTVQGAVEGQELQFSISRPAPARGDGTGGGSNGSTMEVTVVPKRLSSDGPMTVGVYLEPNLVGFERLKAESVPEAVTLASAYVLALTRETASGFLTYFGDLVTGKAQSSEYRVSGPLGVIQRATEVVQTQDWTTVARYAAALSVNLSVLNVVPIPPMDGFQIASTLVQMMFGGSKQ
jgi:membrane-associated protease RseP (regulator of RpoE activity)